MGQRKRKDSESDREKKVYLKTGVNQTARCHVPEYKTRNVETSTHNLLSPTLRIMRLSKADGIKQLTPFLLPAEF